ncbi:hypothetical protein PRIPAC_82800, partial [Pristionchus pacificus]|uniref:Uncharacterized protein n=2 Tax=Pristionchus pacificus TaxID=54126 RepID=A0A2A6CMJ6_PRIPA
PGPLLALLRHDQITRRRPTPVENIYWLKTRSTYILSISTTANNTFTAGPEGLTEAMFIGRRFHPLQYGLSVERGFDIGMQIMPVNTFSYKVRTPLMCTNATCAGSKDGVPLTSLIEVDQLASNFEITFCPNAE